MLNRIIIMGRLTRDPELRRTQNGIAVTSFRVAVDRDFKSQSGERETDFIDVVAWRNQAEFVSKYFSKGRMVIVEGQLQIRDWTDREGQKRTSAEIVADHVRFGETKRDAEGGDYGSGSGYGSAPSGGSYGSVGGSYGAAPSYGGSAPAPGYGSGNSAPGYGAAPAPGYGSGGSSPGYGAAPGYGTPSDQSDFAELGEDDGDLPF